jgi:hypothetical protein
VDLLPDALENVKTLVQEMKGIPKSEVKQRELAYKATKDVLKPVGVFPTPTFNLSVYNDNRGEVISPQVMDIVSKVFNCALNSIEN